ncbi:MAG: MipA/OmpV family protein [Gallionellaceae bacterium]
MKIFLRHRWVFVCLCTALLSGTAQTEATEFKMQIDGDIGLGGYYTRSIVKDNPDALSALPYMDFKYSRMFARIDTFGVKTLEFGYGYLELAGRFSQDGFNTNVPELEGLEKRQNSIPLGVGTLQVTPIGGFMINAFHDINKSQGDVFEMIYGGRLRLPRVTLYPLLGAEYRSKEYVRYYYGISAIDAANSGYAAYEPAGAVTSLIGLIAEVRLTDDYYLNLNVRHRWLGDAIRRSPLVDQRYLDTGYIALSYRFR